MAEPILFVNGAYRPLSQASVSVLDQGFLLGDGIFDVVSAWQGHVFKLDQHVDRFFQSLQATGIRPRLTKGDWKEAILETVRRNDLQDASIRFIATRGVPQGIIADPRHHEATTIVWAAPYIFLADDEGRRRGIRLMLSSLRGFTPDTLDPRYKSLDRLHFQLARLEAVDAGYDDLLWLTRDGYVAEGPASNVFMVTGGTLVTPGREILRGITRQTFIELAAELDIPVREADLTPYDLFNADEVFTCSTAGGALAVREIAGRTIGANAGAGTPQVPGPITRALDELYWRKREAGWHGTAIYGG